MRDLDGLIRQLTRIRDEIGSNGRGGGVGDVWVQHPTWYAIVHDAIEALDEYRRKMEGVE